MMRIRTIEWTRALRPLCVAVAIAAASLCGQASATTLATWTFETSVPTTAGPFDPEVGAGKALGFHSSGSTVYSNPVGNGSLESFSSNFWSVGDYYQFRVDTTGYNAINLTWDQTSSSTGPADFILKYSTDGVNFTNFGSEYSVQVNGTPNAPWSSGGSPNPVFSFAQDLSGVSAINNTASVYFRLVMNSTDSAGGGTVGTAGTDRVDNFSVTATAVPEPATLALGLVGAVGLVAVGARRRRVPALSID